MGISKKLHRRGHDFNNLDLENVGSIKVNSDAASGDDLVRKSQVESIAQSTTEGNLVSLTSDASSTTAFTSSTMLSLLSNKQDNMSIHSSSTAFLSIENGTEIKVKQLLSQNVVVDTVQPSLAAWLSNIPGHTLEEGDMLILQGALVNQERSWIHNGGSTGTASDFTTLVTDYNESVIRGMFSAGNSYLNYDATNGEYSLVFGNSNGQVGAHSIPVNNAEFATITASTVLAALKGLENYIGTVDSNATGGAATIGTRLDSLSGVTGNNLGAFNDSSFPDNSTIKQVFEASLVKHLAADSDRASIKTNFASADASLQLAIDNEVVRATAAEQAEVTARIANCNTLGGAIASNSDYMINQGQIRYQQDNLLSGRLDVIEGASNVLGSVSNGVSSANSFTVQQVGIEAAARLAAVAALDTKVDNLQQGDIKFIGVINVNNTVSIRQELINAGDTRNGSLITAVDLKAGETFITADDLDIGLSDAPSGIAVFEKGDKLMVTQDVTSGSLLLANLNVVPANDSSLSTQNVTGSPTVQMDGNNNLDVKDDSITVDHLQNSLLADINDKRSLTSNNTVTSDADTHFVTDATTGATQNIHFKRTSNTSDALTGTKRALLAELMLSSNGSGNPAAPSFGHAATYATHYNGSSVNMSMSVGGVNSEAVVNNTNAAVYATGQYSLAISSHLGMNAGVTGIAQNAGLSNIGVTGFGKAGGAGNDRGGVFVLSDSAFEAYSTHRGSNPIPYSDVALIADAGTSASGKALVAVGPSVFDGTVIVPDATANNHAASLGDIKSSQYSEVKTIPANGSATINHSLNTKKIIVSVWHNDELITDTIDIDERTVDSFKIHNDTGDTMTNCDIYVMALK